MKKILFLILFFPFFSCDDWIDVESEVSVTYRNYFNNEQEIEALYTSILEAEKKVWASPNLRFFDWSALPCTTGGEYGEPYRKLESTQMWDISAEVYWESHYKAIYMANFMHENRFRYKNITDERADFWLAQASFVKGLMYFRLAQDWGEAVIAPGTEDGSEQGKSPIDAVLAEAIKAAEAALILPTHDKLTDSYGNVITSRQYASVGSVHTLLANIYAWMGGLYGKEEYWKKAEEEASLVIDGKAGFYDLVSMEDLVKKTLGAPRDVTEVIFAIEKNSQDDDWSMSGGMEDYYQGFALLNYPFTETDPRKIENDDIAKISIEDVLALYPDKKDLRRKEYWLNLGGTIEIDTINSQTQARDTFDYQPQYAYLNKWRDEVYSQNPEITQGNKTVLIALEGNRIVWRLADLILLRAECRAQLGMAEAVKDLNRVRQRAGLDEYRGSLTKKDLLKEIFRERERELFGEGQRYYDIVRNGYFRDELIGNYVTLTDEDVKNGALYLRVDPNAFLNNPLMTENIYWLWHRK